MCLICVELAADKLTAIEARRNLSEMREVIDESHRIDVLRFIWRKEDEEWEEWEDLIDVASD